VKLFHLLLKIRAIMLTCEFQIRQELKPKKRNSPLERSLFRSEFAEARRAQDDSKSATGLRQWRGDWTFQNGEATLGARASRPHPWPQATDAASGRAGAGGTPALPGGHLEHMFRSESVSPSSETLLWTWLGMRSRRINRCVVSKSFARAAGS